MPHAPHLQGGQQFSSVFAHEDEDIVRRRIIREKVLQALYAYEISGDPVEGILDYVMTGLDENKTAADFARKLVIKTIQHTEEIDSIIRLKVTNWDFARIAVIDRLILRMSICELLHFREIPAKVSMNEAIELAKLFSTQRSGHFINGVLDAILSEMKATGKLPKSGRGLYEGEPDQGQPKTKRP